MKYRSLVLIGVSVFCVLFTITSCSDEVEPVPIGFQEIQEFVDYRKVDVGWASIDGKVMCGTLYLPKKIGEYPAVIWHFGSNKWSRLNDEINFTKRWLNAGIAVLSYDKRGVHKSQGECCPWRDAGYFPLLGQDVLHGIRTIAEHPEIRPDGIGAYGYSQGGWVLPTAAAELQNEIAFTVIGAGPLVTLDEELLYSAITGEPDCEETNISQEEIARILEDNGPGGFDPVPYIVEMTNPALWVFGGNDLSVPTPQSAALLDEIILEYNKPFEYWIIPDANHSWVIDGGICEYFSETHFADPYDDIFEWINEQLR